jgi:sulfate transport system permease protein
VRRALIVGALAFLAVFLVVPLGAVFAMALRHGLGAYFAAVSDADTRAAVQLTLLAAAVAVPANLVFGLAAAWLIARFRFPGRALLQAFIDLPFTVSPVVAGLLFVLVFGRRGLLGPALDAHGLRVLYAVPAIVLATAFVTLPYVVREVLPVLQAQGAREEEAALTLGAGGLRTFFRITLPKIKWGVLYGVLLCTARAMGEFGAVSVVSGHIRGETITLPLHVEIRFHEYDAVGAFAAASLLAALALVTLAAKKYVEWRSAPA